MSAVSEESLIDAVDETDTPITTVPRQDVFRLRANFRVAHVLVFNANRDLLLQRLALNRERNPGYWGSSVAAYLFSHEDYAEAAQRRITEELGIHGARLSFFGKTEMQDDGCTKFISVFETVYDGPIQYDHNHIDRVEFMPIPMIKILERAGSFPFTPTFRHVWDFYTHTEPSSFQEN